ncbi:hypothetical protein IU421_05995 [Nocardia cyriacigeorgica]|uniref:hypothetical protein n=1 Tax=Nocardia cyriacigeorgica TaxID=135487 RepID=UPI0018962C2B|nr:hypothetical protein [Nocardia cyriacigeorgica]MBF6316855.1 hypothetical protein [Nocardia cyriacigeorgica]MBF6513834.1 hypothetical protein [Nocardia cyriacigeorgica]MBF6535504.1 hypothetical protein [Nocardia cyriacigeorgica]
MDNLVLLNGRSRLHNDFATISALVQAIAEIDVSAMSRPGTGLYGRWMTFFCAFHKMRSDKGYGPNERYFLKSDKE